MICTVHSVSQTDFETTVNAPTVKRNCDAFPVKTTMYDMLYTVSGGLLLNIRVLDSVENYRTRVHLGTACFT